jgi:acetylornithine/N-succinyldiaminopimelate aminotransferase
MAGLRSNPLRPDGVLAGGRGSRNVDLFGFNGQYGLNRHHNKQDMNTIALEDRYAVPFFKKLPVSIERGKGIYVWDESGRQYMDFTAGWGVTCLGHAHPVMIDALTQQCSKIWQNPSSGLTYSPIRAQLLALLAELLPGKLSRVFFSNSGAEANDAVIKLARKVSGRTEVISTHKSFHGRTISTASATGQAKHREKFNPLMPSYRFVPYNDLPAMKAALNRDVAAVLLEPIQGEGGVRLPDDHYLQSVSELCTQNGSYLIIDEVQTGFCRTGRMFAIDSMEIEVDFMTMAKGIAGGFPFGAFAVSERIAAQIEIGDHGGTYCGNPLGCAVAYAVIRHLKDNRLDRHVAVLGEQTLQNLQRYQEQFPQLITAVRGKGLLLAIEFEQPAVADAVMTGCLDKGLFVNLTQGNIVRIFPALNITAEEMATGLSVLASVLNDVAAGTEKA